MRKPFTAVTTGDPAGIGPEICVEALTKAEVYDKMNPFLIGDETVIRKAMKVKNIDYQIHLIQDPQEGLYQRGTIDLMTTGDYDVDSIEYGKVQKLCGRMAMDFIMRAIELGNEGKVDVVGTAPINKQAIKLVGVPEPGHTEIFPDYTHSKYSLTMFNVENMRVFFLSRHISLQNAIKFANKEHCLEFLTNIDEVMRSLGLKHPEIALAALNPHGSDNGLFGTEEHDELIPAVKEAQARGINAVGPVPADSVFWKMRKGHYDAILSLYHDQGHIACKTLDFEKAITITWGLPFMRSAVDHGTAFDIAGKGIAQAVSMVESLTVACDYWQMQQKAKAK